MKLPLSWVSLYSDLTPLLQHYTPKKLAHEYSIHTAEIDSIEICDIDKVVIGRVRSCEKHPDSKKLSIVVVEISGDGETTTILTGAPNIVDAQYVPVALVGCTLPGDFTISERQMAGMISRGMICSIDELGLAEGRADGILILEEIWSSALLDSLVGKSFFDLPIEMPGLHGEKYLTPLRDIVFEIDNKFITNRPDLFGVVGNAREFHAVFQTSFRPYTSLVETDRLIGDIGGGETAGDPPVKGGSGSEAEVGGLDSAKKETPLPPLTGGLLDPGAEISPHLSLSIETPLVSAYHMLVMRGVEISDSPFGLSVMLHRAEMSVKMDIVDITNAIMTELGQPMHAFDADKIVGGIVVRMARGGEKFLALNGVEITLTPDDIVIADHEKVLALAGVIGGMDSAVSRETRNIIWESACFDPATIRLSAQRHGIRTDASTRYEKSLDPLLAESGITRAIEYMDFLGKSYQITDYQSHIDTHAIRVTRLHLTREQVMTKIGVEIPTDDFEGILARLGFHYQCRILDPQAKHMTLEYTVTVPSWRATKDIDIWEDIAEEIGRVYGYDRVAEKTLDSDFSIAARTPEITLRDQTLEYLSQHGWMEAYHYSFSNARLDQSVGYSDMSTAIKIENAFNEEYTHMRRSLAPRLLLSTHENLKHTEQFSLFELGQVFEKGTIDSLTPNPSPKGEGSSSPLLGATGTKGSSAELVRGGSVSMTEFSSPFSQYKMLAGVTTKKDLDSLKADLEGYLLSTIGFVPPIRQGADLPFLHPGVSGVYHLDDLILARFGRVHPAVASEYELPETVLYFEVSYPDVLARLGERDQLFHEIARYPSVDRELNFILPDRKTTGDVMSFIDSLHPWISGVRVASIYRDDDRVGVEKKSVTFSFSITNPEATITDTEALEIQNMIIERMAGEGWMLRG